MDRESFIAFLNSEHQRIIELCETKGPEHSSNDDVTSNFKEHAEDLEISPLLVWQIYAGKHWIRIRSYCKRGFELDDEPIEVRVRDLKLYLDLLLVMTKDQEVRDLIEE